MRAQRLLGTQVTVSGMGMLLKCRVNAVSIRRCLRGAGVSGGVEDYDGSLNAPRGRCCLRLLVPTAHFVQEGVEEGFQAPPGGSSGDGPRQAFSRVPYLPGSSLLRNPEVTR